MCATIEQMTNSDRMWALAATFPTLHKWAGRPDRGHFDGDVVLAALKQPWVTSGSRFALLFLADVWNTSIRADLPPRLRKWSIVDALASWDGEHRAAAVAWMSQPWWP
jgi:hypothetical protein